jgi:hypothetical protein
MKLRMWRGISIMALLALVTAATHPDQDCESVGCMSFRHLSGTVNAQDYGARCDGHRDDTQALRLAAAAIPSMGGALIFSAGTGNCMVSGPIRLKSNTHVIGLGATMQNLPWDAWTPPGVGTTLLLSGVTNITIQGMRFQYQHSFYNGGGAHIVEAVHSSNIVLRDNVSDGGGDFLASIGSSNVLSEDNIVTNVDNACFDHWGGSNNIRVTNNYCTAYDPARHGGVGAIQFTGINTDGSAALNYNFYAAGNTVYINAVNGQAITLNGAAKGGSDDKQIITGNHIYVTVPAWGILVTGNANNGIIANNYIDGSGGVNFSAIKVASPARNWTISGNIADGMRSGGNGVFVNSGSGGLLANNIAYNSSSPLIGPIGTGIILYGNGNGGGTLDLANVKIEHGSASFTSDIVTAGSVRAVGAPSWGWNGSGDVAETINAAAGTNRKILIETAGKCRWSITTTNTAESGGDAGSDLQISSCHDDGSINGSPLTIARASSTVKVEKLALAPATPANNLATCTTGQIAVDASYIYVCTAANTWKRAVLSGF